jgi:methyl-accepting chemotaxis protein
MSSSDSFLPSLDRPFSRRLLALIGVTLVAAALHLAWPDVISAAEAMALVLGMALGQVSIHFIQQPKVGRNRRANDVVAQDINTLRQAFDVLSRQVQTTIDTSEGAVMAMMDRMNRVHQNAVQLRQRIMVAVERSQQLSSDSLSSADAHSSTISQLATHQEEFERSQRANQDRIRAVAEQVRQLSPLAALISDISRQTNLLAINASIEAARAGREGAGFKVVATEVRRLSTQTAEAARQITEGIQAAATTIDDELANAEAMQGSSAATQLEEVARHVQVMGQTLAEVVPYLGELSTSMDSGMAEVNSDIIETLGDMQFQDINRQLLEHIKDAMASLSEHFAQIYELIDGEAPPPPVLLEELLATWTSNYVMHSQRVAHASATGGEVLPEDWSEGATPVDGSTQKEGTDPNSGQPLQLATANGPRIELF